jgi:hypothetical protein
MTELHPQPEQPCISCLRNKTCSLCYEGCDKPIKWQQQSRRSTSEPICVCGRSNIHSSTVSEREKVLDEVLKKIQSYKKWDNYSCYFLGDDLEHMIERLCSQKGEQK